MLIGEFPKKAGLSQDIVRFYVREGLLAPQTGSKGGRGYGRSSGRTMSRSPERYASRSLWA